MVPSENGHVCPLNILKQFFLNSWYLRKAIFIQIKTKWTLQAQSHPIFHCGCSCTHWPVGGQSWKPHQDVGGGSSTHATQHASTHATKPKAGRKPLGTWSSMPRDMSLSWWHASRGPYWKCFVTCGLALNISYKWVSVTLQGFCY